MIEHLGSWIDVSRTSATVKEFRFGNVRVARIRLSRAVAGQEEAKMWEGRIYLPGVGADEIVWAWTQNDIKRGVEEILSEWVFQSGIQELFNAAGAAIESTFVMPDSVVVTASLPFPPASAKIVPLEEHRRNGGRGLLPPQKTNGEAPAPSKMPRKPSHKTRRALTRGQ